VTGTPQPLAPMHRPHPVSGWFLLAAAVLTASGCSPTRRRADATQLAAALLVERFELGDTTIGRPAASVAVASLPGADALPPPPPLLPPVVLPPAVPVTADAPPVALAGSPVLASNGPAPSGTAVEDLPPPPPPAPLPDPDSPAGRVAMATDVVVASAPDAEATPEEASALPAGPSVETPVAAPLAERTADPADAVPMGDRLPPPPVDVPPPAPATDLLPIYVGDERGRPAPALPETAPFAPASAPEGVPPPVAPVQPPAPVTIETLEAPTPTPPLAPREVTATAPAPAVSPAVLPPAEDVVAAPGTRVSIAELVRREMAAAADAAEAAEPAAAPAAPAPSRPAPVAPPVAAVPASVPTPPVVIDAAPASSPGDPDAVPFPTARLVGGPPADLPNLHASGGPGAAKALPEPPTSLAPLPDLPAADLAGDGEGTTEIGARDPIDDDFPTPDADPAPQGTEAPVAAPTFSPPASVPPAPRAGGSTAPAPVPPTGSPAPSAGNVGPREGFQFTAPATSREALVAAHVKALRADPEGRDRQCWPVELVRTVPAATALQKGARPALVVFYDDRAKASRLAAADLWPVVLEVESKVDLILVDLTPGGPRALTDDERRLVRRYYLGYVPTTVVLGSDRVPRLLKSERVDPALVRAASLEAK
jgi:hypothetical protein